MAIERISDLEVRVTTPLTEEDVMQLKIGDHVRITGVIYTARDAAHNRMLQALEAGQPMPIDVRASSSTTPGPRPPGPVASSAPIGPTTSMRMDPFTPRSSKPASKPGWARAIVARKCRKRCRQYKAVFFDAVGGAGAMLSQFIKSVEVVAYEDLGTESLKRIRSKICPPSSWTIAKDATCSPRAASSGKTWKSSATYTPSERIVVSGG